MNLKVGRPESDASIDAINRSSGAVLIRGACVLTMDPDVGDLAQGDVLVEGGRISRIGAELADSASTTTTVIDARDCIVMPGFVDTHRHMWQGQLRRMIPNVDIAGYLAVRNSFAVEYEPEDSHIGTIAIAYGALHSGVTTVLDLAHNTRSAAHSDAEIAALRASGIRAVYACAPPEAGEWDRHWPGDLERLQQEIADDEHVTLRMAQRCFSDEDNLDSDRVAIARELGLGLTVDPVGWDRGSATIDALASQGLLGEDMTFVHCCDLSPEAWNQMGEAGVGVSLSPFVDDILGWGAEGLPTVQKALDVGLVPGVSVDIETTVPADVFTQMRALLAAQRMRGSLGNPDSDREQLTARQVTGFATRDGARIIGLGDICGTLTPGKAADIVILDCSDPNLHPMSNAYGTVAMGADSSNVKAVLVSGEIKKWGHQLVGVDLADIRQELERSRDRLAHRVGFELDPFADYPTI
jgi:cytosine/adenosine deaminase-related metal-dependent hydrolase